MTTKIDERPGSGGEDAGEVLLRAENRVLEMMAVGVPVGEVLSAIAAMVEQADPGDLCSVMLMEGERGQMRCAARGGLPGEYVDAIDGLRIGPKVGSCGTAAFTGKRVVVSDIGTDKRWAGFRKLPLKHGLRACWSQPIVGRGGKVLGTVAHYSRQAGEPSERQVLLLEMAAHLAGIAIERG